MVVLNGYVRQAVALGITLLSIRYLHESKIGKSMVFTFLASTFHETALAFLTWLLWEIRKRKSSPLLLLGYAVAAAGVVLISMHIFNRTDALWEAYILQQMESRGQLIRSLVNLVAGGLLLLFKKSWEKTYKDYSFWVFAVYISTLLTSAGVILNVSTVADRLLLYFYPLQVVVFPRIAKLISCQPIRYAYTISVVMLYTAMLLVWLLFAVHRTSWIPYKNILFM